MTIFQNRKHIRVTLPSRGGTGDGFTGSQGSTGFTGSQGDIGYTGSQGNTGYTGSASTVVGYTGSLGYTGSQGTGFTGSQGSQGIQGEIGFTGSQGIGFTGSKGDQGIQGDLGYTGSQGTGFTGSQGIQGDLGYTGSEGIGFTGSQGIQGYTGSAGAGATNITVSDFASGVVDVDLSSVSASDDTIASAKAIKDYVDNQFSEIGDGYTGSQGEIGYTGSQGIQGEIGFTGSKGADGTIGVDGYTGSQGEIGFTGSAGSGGDSPFVFTTSGDYRTLTGYIESGVTNTVRTAEFSSNLLRLTLATFTPSFSASGNPSSTNNWDVPATGFSVSVDNPSDVTNDFISSVYSITQTSGSVNGTLSNYSAGSYSQTPAGGVDWNQTFTVDNSSSYIRPISTDRTGGSAGATIKFNHNDGSESEYTDSNTSFSVNWSTASMSLSKTNVSGKTFLKSYASTSYSTNTSGISNSSNTSHALTASGGTLSTNSGSGYVSGTFTFTSPIHKDNTSDTRTVSNTCTFTRPVDVTGSSYTIDQSSTTSNISASFTYPSFWIWTTGVGTTPTLSDIIDDTTSTGFDSAVNQLADQTRTFSVQSVNNSDSNPRAFWFAVRNSASQPGTFKTGASAGLLSDVSTTDGGTITLVPDSPLSEQTGESYHLYGFTLQPGTTYVEIGA
jgi:collagen type VII alpha